MAGQKLAHRHATPPRQLDGCHHEHTASSGNTAMLRSDLDHGARRREVLDARGEMTNPRGYGFGDGDPDGTAWPIPGTISPVWGASPPRAQMLMAVADVSGQPDRKSVV